VAERLSASALRVALNLGYAKFIYMNEINGILHFYNSIDKLVTYYFASFRMSTLR
jgi:hypothetical protein